MSYNGPTQTIFNEAVGRDQYRFFFSSSLFKTRQYSILSYKLKQKNN